MKKFLFLALGAAFVLQGLIEWLINGNEALSSLPFALSVVCLVLATTIRKQNGMVGIFGQLETYEKVGLTVVVVLILAIIGFFLWGIIDNFFPQINWKYFLSLIGVIITITVSCGVVYSLNGLWNYLLETDDDIPFWKKAKDKLLFFILVILFLILPDKN